MPKRNSIKLTETYISKSLKLPPNGRVEIFDSQEDSLCLRVSSTGKMSWCIYYRLGQSNRKFTIGQYPTYSIAEARDAAGIIKKTVAKGIDPVEQRKKKKASYRRPNSIEEMSDLFIERYVERNLKASTARDYRSHFRLHILPAWKGRMVTSITRQDVVTLLDKVEDRAPIQCNRVQATISSWFSWMVDERAVLELNPLLRLKKRTPENRRSRVLSKLELFSIWEASTNKGWPFGIICKLLILTAKRRTEITGMKWNEINWDEKTWIIPSGQKGRTKNRLDDVVPLSEQVLSLLTSLPKNDNSEFVFPSQRRSDRPVSGFSRAKDRISELSGVEEWTFHDLRRTVRSNLSSLHVPKEVADKVLNHIDGSIDGKHYDWHDYLSEKREALQTWANYLDQILDQVGGDNIVALSGR